MSRHRRRRFLFVVPPYRGHVNRVQGVAVELARRGHRVAWFGPSRELRPLLPKRARLFGLRADAYEAARAAVAGARPARPLWIELGLAALASAEAAVDDFRPDVLVIDRLRTTGDELTTAGVLAARRRGLPWATSARDVTERPPSPPAGSSALEQLQHEAGVEPAEWPLDSLDLVLVFSVAELVGDATRLPPQVRLVGPALGPRVEATPFPWEALGPRPRVFVSLGTVNSARSRGFYEVVVDALGGAPAQVILAAPPKLVPHAPANLLVRPFVPQLALLPHVDAVVSHGGHNTVAEALSHGLPLVLAPIMADQPVNARSVAAAGAGIVVRHDRVSSAELRRAVTAVLEEPRYRAAAELLRRAFEAAGGAPAAADALEQLG